MENCMGGYGAAWSTISRFPQNTRERKIAILPDRIEGEMGEGFLENRKEMGEGLGEEKMGEGEEIGEEEMGEGLGEMGEKEEGFGELRYLPFKEQKGVVGSRIKSHYHTAITAFRAFDQDHDQVLSQVEFHQGLQKFKISQECIEYLWQQASCNTNYLFCRYQDFQSLFFPRASKIHKVQVVVPQVRLREKPKSNGETVDILEQGETFDVKLAVGDWVQVKKGGVQGWALKRQGVQELLRRL